MANRITAGQGLFGALNVGTSATIAAANITTPYVGGTQVTATADEMNKLDLSAVGAQRRWKVITVSGTGLKSSEVDSGWALPTRCIVHDVYLHFTLGTSASGTMSVGLLSTTSGDADGFIKTVPTSSAGYAASRKLYSPTLTWTSSGVDVSAAAQSSTGGYGGAYLYQAIVSNTTANIGMTSKISACFTSETSSKNISYTMSTTANDSFSANIIVDYTEIA